jgi:hypothetical protein
MQRDNDEEQQEERAEIINPESIEDIIGRMTARMDQEVEELIDRWNDRQISPRDLEDALAARTRTIEDVLESQLKENSKYVRLSKLFHAVLEKATKIMIKPPPDGWRPHRDMMRKITKVQILVGKYLALHRCVREARAKETT